MYRMARIIGLLCAGLMLSQTAAGQVSKADGQAPAAKSAGPMPTDREARRFASAMTRAVQDRDAAAFDKLFRIEALVERIAGDLGLAGAEREGFMNGAAKVLARRSFGQNILDATRDGGSYKLLRVHTVAGRPHVRFRLLGPAGELNYHEYELTRFADGKVAAADVFVYLLGEPLSETVFQIVVPALNSGKGTLGTPKFDLQQLGAMRTFSSMSQAIQAGDFAKAVTEYGKLPKKWQEEKRVLVLYMQATAGLGAGGEPNYLAAMERFRKLYPNDACVDFISIDYFFLKKQYDDARKAVDHLDKVVGGDPYLDVVRGNCWMEAGRFDAARTALENAVKAEPDLANACWARIALSLREKKHNDTLVWLKWVVEQCHEQVLDLTTLPDYAHFVRSPEHALWLTWYGSRAR